jgi:hypothetical protein
MKMPVLVLSLILTGSTVAQAQTADRSLIASFWAASAPDQKARQALAREWLDAFTRLDVAIPALAPSQREWLRTEYDQELQKTGMPTPRALAAMGTLEYQLRIAKPGVGDIVTPLRALASRPIGDARQEALLWLRLSAALSDLGFWQSVSNLVERKIVTGPINGVSSHYFENHARWAREILLKAAIPLLESATLTR